MLGQFTRKDKTDRGLDFTRRDGRLLRVRGKARSFAGNALKDVVDERVENGHGLVGDTSVRVDLLQY